MQHSAASYVASFMFSATTAAATMTEHRESISTYLRFKRRYGDKIGLYLCGISGLGDFKWIAIVTLITSLMNAFVLYTNNQVIFDENNISLQLIILFVISKTFDKLNRYFLKSLIIKKELEINKILGRILSYVNNVYFYASYTWKAKYTREDRTDSFQSISYLTRTLEDVFEVLETITSFLSLLIIGTLASYHITFVIASGIVVMHIQRQFFNKKTDCKKRIEQWQNARDIIANQFANQIDVDYSDPFARIMHYDSYDPSVGTTEEHRQRILNQTKRFDASSDVAAVIVLCLSAAYLFWVGNAKFLVFLMINHCTLQNIHHIQDSISQKWNTDLVKTFEMLADVAGLAAVSVHVDGPTLVLKDSHISLDIQGIRKTIVDDKLSLVYGGPIRITSDDKVILLNGRKGCGKSVTADILGGRYDGSVTDGMTYNLTHMHGEFRDMRQHVCYIRQCILDEYRNNTKNTIVMPLAELFPGGSYGEIRGYLKEFDVEHKMPTGAPDDNSSGSDNGSSSNPHKNAPNEADLLHVPLSKSERGLSPGEMQTIVFASQFWKICM